MDIQSVRLPDGHVYDSHIQVMSLTHHSDLSLSIAPGLLSGEAHPCVSYLSHVPGADCLYLSHVTATVSGVMFM